MDPCFLLTEHSSMWNTLVLRGGARDICLWLVFKNLWNNVNSDESFPHAELVNKKRWDLCILRKDSAVLAMLKWLGKWSSSKLKQFWNLMILPPWSLTRFGGCEERGLRNQRWWGYLCSCFRTLVGFPVGSCFLFPSSCTILLQIFNKGNKIYYVWNKEAQGHSRIKHGMVSLWKRHNAKLHLTPITHPTPSSPFSFLHFPHTFHFQITTLLRSAEIVSFFWL